MRIRKALPSNSVALLLLLLLLLLLYTNFLSRAAVVTYKPRLHLSRAP
jgi:hypothetical protein